MRLNAQSTVKKKTPRNTVSTTTITAVMIVSRRVGHTTLAVSALTCWTKVGMLRSHAPMPPLLASATIFLCHKRNQAQAAALPLGGGHLGPNSFPNLRPRLSACARHLAMAG